MDCVACPAPKLTWHEWLALAQEQGFILNMPDQPGMSASDQANAFYFLRNELINYPSSASIDAVIAAYDGKSDDYYAQMLWAKRAHLLAILPSITAEDLQKAPALHQMQITKAKESHHFDVEQLWIVVQDLLQWQKEAQEREVHQANLIKISQNAPQTNKMDQGNTLDMQKSLERWRKTDQGEDHD